MKRFFLIVILLFGIVWGVYWLSHQVPSARGGSGSLASTSDRKDVPSTTTFTPETDALVMPKDVPLLEAINRETVNIAQSVIPSVVSIMVTKEPQKEMDMDLFPQLPPQFRPQRPSRSTPDEAFGSGVIISREGHIVTNNHVIARALKIEVTLYDGRRLPAKLIGADEPGDIAVLKIEADNLKALVWGDSDKLRVGEFVMAIGSPYQLEESVSRGIISAKGRNPEFAGNNSYSDYLQTDAAINPGNSGGALVNIRGELIGINTAIASRSGGFQGIGFAIPSNLARFSLESLIKSGKVVRGFLGVKIQDITPELKEAFDVTTDDGALVSEVYPNSPASRAGLQRGDVVVGYDNQPVKDPATLRLAVAQTPIGRATEIKVIRSGKEKELSVTVGELPADALKDTDASDDNAPAAPGSASQDTVDNVLKGLKVQDIDKDSRQRLNLKDDVTGVIITAVGSGSAGEDAGLLPGDVIQEVKIKGQPSKKIADSKSFLETAKTIGKDQLVVLLVNRKNNSSFITLRPDN